MSRKSTAGRLTCRIGVLVVIAANVKLGVYVKAPRICRLQGETVYQLCRWQSVVKDNSSLVGIVLDIAIGSGDLEECWGQFVHITARHRQVRHVPPAGLAVGPDLDPIVVGYDQIKFDVDNLGRPRS